MILCVSNRLAFIFLLVVSYCGMSFSAWANPDLPVVDPLGVRSGISSITTNSAQTAMTINTNSAQSLQDFRTFNVGAGRTVTITQPTPTSNFLARVTGSQASTIQGNVLGNGNFWLANPNGILISPTGQITNFQGVVATTNRYAPTEAQRFLSGDLNGVLQQNQLGQQAVTNQGTIRTEKNGFVVLSGGGVNNTANLTTGSGGVIDSPAGAVSLVGANRVTLVSTTGSRITLDTTNLTALAKTTGFQHVLNQKGVVRANSVEVGKTGQIVLGASDTLDTKVATSSTFTPRVEANNTHGGRGGSITLGSGNAINPMGLVLNDTVNNKTAVLSANSIGDGGTINIAATGNIYQRGAISATGGTQATANTANAGNVSITSGSRIELLNLSNTATADAYTNMNAAINVNSLGSGGSISLTAPRVGVYTPLSANNTRSGLSGASGGNITIRSDSNLWLFSPLSASSINTTNGRGGTITIYNNSTGNVGSTLQLSNNTWGKASFDTSHTTVQGSTSLYARYISLSDSYNSDYGGINNAVIANSKGHLVLSGVSSVSQSGTLQRSSGQGTLTLLTSPTGRISILNRGTATRPESIIWNDTINLYTGSGGITIAKPVSTTQGQVNAFFNATQLSSVSYLGKSFQFADRLLGGVITGGNTSRATVQYQEYTGGPLGSVRGATGQPLQLWTRI